MKTVRDILCCPECKSSLSFEESSCKCLACHRVFPIKDGKYFFRSIGKGEEIHDGLDKLKYRLKSFPRIYNKLLIDIFSPVLPNNGFKRILESLDGSIINIGSGSSVIGEKVINVDMFDYANVHIVADIQSLPFRVESVDGMFNFAVLEHVARPQEVVAEVHRVLKPGGVVFSAIPFMQPFHASPYDFQRYTLSGIQVLHKEFETISVGTYGGPVSGFLWVLQEFLSMVFSFGIVPLRNALSIVFMILTWPLKYFDYIFRRMKTSDNIASSFYFYGRKKFG